MTINERIKDLRVQHGYTLKDVAARIGVSEGTVQRYESGAIKEVPYDSIIKLSTLYGCDPAYLMGWQMEYRVSDLKPLGKLEEEDAKLLRAYYSAPANIQAGIRQILGV